MIESIVQNRESQLTVPLQLLEMSLGNLAALDLWRSCFLFANPPESLAMGLMLDFLTIGCNDGTTSYSWELFSVQVLCTDSGTFACLLEWSTNTTPLER